MSGPPVAGTYRQRNPGWHAEDAPHKAAAVGDFLESIGLAPEHVVDVGCGTGDVLRHLRTRWDAQGRTTVTYEGWEPEPSALDLSPSPRLTLRVGWPPASRARADVVLALDVVEHVEDDLAFLRAVAALGDVLVLRVPLEDSAWDRLRGTAARHLARYGHLRAYHRPALHALLDRAGLEVLGERYDRVPPGPMWLPGRLLDGIRRLGLAKAPHATARLLGGVSVLLAARPRR